MMIEINKLSFSYSDSRVLDDISLYVAPGQRWAIIGRNGAGKSTMVRCVAGLEYGYKGAITIDGKDLRGLHPRVRAKMIAYVPQAQGVHIPYTVYEYVMMGRFPYLGFMASVSRSDKDIVKQSLELTDTYNFSQRSMQTLSGGEVQRVLLAGAVAQQTPILLLDEPATFLDPLHQEHMHQALERIHTQYQCTIMTVTHDINAALFRYEKIVALVNGKIYYAGDANVPAEKYATMLSDIYGIAFVKGYCDENKRDFVAPRRLGI